MHNLKLIYQAAWRVRIVHYVAKALGVLVHVDGMPFGSARIVPNRAAYRQQRPIKDGGGDGSWKRL
ncbi:hypothetical protein OIU35_31635 [Boseaceae bacterium BT-24-1]|nr:hypothetical protein [Boseaceae bacterium BT-24-1]